jgi:hypothetical protein
VFTSLFIESKETLETLKILGFSPCATRTLQNPNKIKFHKIGLQLLFSSRMSALDRRSCALDCNSAINPFLARESASALVPCLERSSTSALDRRSPAIDCFSRNSSFSQVCSLSPIFLEMLPFLPKTYKTRKTQKENKIEQNNTS